MEQNGLSSALVRSLELSAAKAIEESNQNVITSPDDNDNLEVEESPCEDLGESSGEEHDVGEVSPVLERNGLPVDLIRSLEISAARARMTIGSEEDEDSPPSSLEQNAMPPTIIRSMKIPTVKNIRRTVSYADDIGESPPLSSWSPPVRPNMRRRGSWIDHIPQRW